MNGQRRETWLEKNLMAVILAGVTASVGYVAGTSNAAVMAEKIVSLETRLDKQDTLNAAIERRMNERRGFMTCSTFSMKQIEQRLKLDPPCKLEVPE